MSAFKSWMLLDVSGKGKVENERITDWILDNFIVNNTELLEQLRETYNCIPSPDELINGTLEEKRKKIAELEDNFMLNLFNQMDKMKERWVRKSDYENWFISKMPKMNGHERTKIISMLTKEFKSRDKNKKNYLVFEEFKETKEYILAYFYAFNQFSIMDPTGIGSVD